MLPQTTGKHGTRPVAPWQYETLHKGASGRRCYRRGGYHYIIRIDYQVSFV